MTKCAPHLTFQSDLTVTLPPYTNLHMLLLLPFMKGCTFVIGILGLGAAGALGSSGLAGSFSDWASAVKLPRGLTFSVLGVSTVGRSSSVTETTSILEGSGCSGASVFESW